MGLSIGGITAYSMNPIQPLNYSVKNQSQVSSAYQDSVKEVKDAGPFASLTGVSPVQYPNAMIKPADPMEKAGKTVETSKQYNDIASAFEGKQVGYSAASASYGYGMTGSTIDFYA